MKEEPPERQIRKRNVAARLESFVWLAILFSFGMLYLVSDQSLAGMNQLQVMGLRESFAGPVWLIVVAIFAIILLNGLFVAVETALDLLRPVHMRHTSETGEAQRKLEDLLENKTRYIASCTLGSQTAWLAMIVISFLLAPGLEAVLWPDLKSTNGTLLLSAVLVALPAMLVNIIFGELVPKSYAALHPLRICLGLYGFARTFNVIFSLPAGFFTAIAGLITARFGGRASFAIPNLAEEEIKTLVDSAQEIGEMHLDEKEMLHSVFEFTDTVAREIMTPRIDLDAMPTNSDPMEIVRLMRETGHSRIPLYEGTDDQILGIIHAKDLFLALLEEPKKTISLRKIMRPALFVPESKNLHELLAEMRASRNQLAVVKDEFGGTAGIVTTEDIVEEIVGDIIDEYDVEEPELVEVDGRYVVSGKMHLDDLNEALNSEFESEEFDTVGGYVFGLFGRQPKFGETVDDLGYRFTVSETDGRRILQLKVEALPKMSDLEALEHAE